MQGVVERGETDHLCYPAHFQGIEAATVSLDAAEHRRNFRIGPKGRRKDAAHSQSAQGSAVCESPEISRSVGDPNVSEGKSWEKSLLGTFRANEKYLVTVSWKQRRRKHLFRSR
ncbi:MAG: hypothetical protein ABW088_07300, partial [Sedimenticola sp.]